MCKSFNSDCRHKNELNVIQQQQQKMAQKINFKLQQKKSLAG